MSIQEALLLAAIAAGLGALWGAFTFGQMAAEVRFLRTDAARYAALRRRNVTVDNGPVLMPHEFDRVCDALALRDAIERHQKPNAKGEQQ